jgi:hypothetical protein
MITLNCKSPPIYRTANHKFPLLVSGIIIIGLLSCILAHGAHILLSTPQSLQRERRHYLRPAACFLIEWMPSDGVIPPT